MADTSCSSFKLIHVDVASPKGLRAKCVKFSELSSKGIAEGQSLCCIKSWGSTLHRAPRVRSRCFRAQHDVVSGVRKPLFQAVHTSESSRRLNR